MQLQWGRGRGRNIARPQLKNQSFCPISPSPLGSLVFHPFPVFLYFPLSTSRYPVSFSRERGLPSLVYTDTHLFTKESKSTIAFPEISRISWMRMTSYRRIIYKTEKVVVWRWNTVSCKKETSIYQEPIYSNTCFGLQTLYRGLIRK